jgi:hypothetical protein
MGHAPFANLGQAWPDRGALALMQVSSFSKNACRLISLKVRRAVVAEDETFGDVPIGGYHGQ